MAFATGGSAVGDTTMRSRPKSLALRMAAGVGRISTLPSGNTARTSRARIASLTFSLIRGRRGGMPLGNEDIYDRDSRERIIVMLRWYPDRDSAATLYLGGVTMGSRSRPERDVHHAAHCIKTPDHLSRHQVLSQDHAF